MTANAKKAAIDKYMGPEPTFSGPVLYPNDPNLIRALSWYQYYKSVAEARKWIREYLAEDQKKTFDKVPDNRITLTTCSMARMYNNGVIFSKELVNKLDNQISALLDIKIERKKSDEINVISIADRVKAKANAFIAFLEEIIDSFETTDFNMYSHLTKNEIPKAYCDRIVSYYQPLLDELTLAKKGKEADIKEAYKHLSKESLTKYFNLVTMIVQDATRFAQNKKAVKKVYVTKKKAVDNNKIVSSVKYKKDDKALKLVSANPADIIGAKIVLIYNCKYRKLTLLSSEATGFHVRGTTIVNIDMASSITKTVRKPEEFLPKMLAGAKGTLTKAIQNLTTKTSVTAGRLSDETIILRCIK